MKLQNTEDNLRIVKLQFCVFFWATKDSVLCNPNPTYWLRLDHIYFAWLQLILGIVIFWIVCDNIKGF